MLDPKNSVVRISAHLSQSESLKEFRAMTPIMKKVQRIGIDSLETQLVAMLNTADDRLFDMAENSFNNAQFDAMRLLRVKREGLVRCFKQALSNNFRSLLYTPDGQQTSNVEPLSFDNISLVKNDDLEEEIAIDSMVKKAVVANHTALEHIRQRFEFLIEDRAVAMDEIPIAPLLVAQAFKNATKTLDLDIASLLVIYKLFDRSVMQQLPQTYLTLNQFLASESVLSDLSDHPKPLGNRVSQASSTQQLVSQLMREQGQNAIQNNSRATNQATHHELLNEIHCLLANTRPATSSNDSENQPAQLINTGDGSIAPGEIVVDTQQLVDLLSQLQASQSPEQRRVISAGKIKQSLTVALPELKQQNLGGAIGSLNEDMIDIVSMLFDFILEDNSIQPEVKSIIGRLQIPMLKVGLVDPKFIANRRHPARLLLNELAHAGISCDMRDISSQPMFDKIQQIADKIIQDFSDDIGLFEQLLTEFNDFKAQFLRKTNIFEKRIKEAEEGKAKAESARSQVNQCLNDICHKKRLPEVVKLILKNIWSHVMLLEQLKNNQQGWDNRKKVAKLLVWSLQGFDSAERLEKLVSKVPMLVKSIKKGAELISFSQIELEHLLEMLEQEHRQLIERAKQAINGIKDESILRLPAIDLDSTSINEVTLPAPSGRAHIDEPPLIEDCVSEEIIIEDIGFTALETGAAFAPKAVEPIPIDNQVMQIIEQLRAGSWIELKIDGEFKRCKLAARIASSGKYIFVNRNGMKMADMLTIELCQAYQQGDMKIIDDDALFDRALESVISNLRSMKA